MKIKKLFLIFTALSAISFSFISCFNIFNQLEENPCNDTEEGATAPGQITNLGIPDAAPITYATLQGRISFDGALPAEVLTATSAGTDNGGNGSERTALPSMSTTWVYVLQATADGQTNPEPVVVQANSTAPGYSYPGLATSQSGISWTITVRLKKNQTDSDDLGIMIDSCTLNLTNDNSIYIHDFMVKPATGGSGTLDLLMKVPVSVASISVECSDTGWVAPTTQFSTITGDTANKNASIQKSGIPSGTYSVRFNFKDSNGLLLYSNRQSINIFNNCTTSIWVNSGTTGNSDPIDSSGNYTVIQAMISNFQNNTFYVGPTSFNDTPGTVANGFNGTPLKPLSNVSDVSTIIGARADSTTAEYTIIVNGAISGTQSITSACNGKAKSIRLCGLDTTKDQSETWKPKHQLTGDAQNGGTTLTIGTSVLVTIDNLLITGGSNPNGNGGGIAITGGNVELTTGTVVTGNTANKGGGLYLTSGNLYLNDSAVVGKPVSALGSTPACATSSSYANKATVTGGGISIEEGTLWLGYSSAATPAPVTTSGGVIYNLVTSTGATQGGGIDNYNGIINIARGVVSYNYASGTGNGSNDVGSGGGISTTKTLDLQGNAEISHNESAYGGAVYIGNGGSFTMSAGTIKLNASEKQHEQWGDGGGIAIGGAGNFTMSGGTISENTADSSGGAIYHNGTTLEISGNTATIPKGTGANNIQLNTVNQKIKISGSTGHTGTGAIAVTPYRWKRGDQIFADGSTASYFSKFTLTDSEWRIVTHNSIGKLDADIWVASSLTNSTEAGRGTNVGVPPESGRTGTKSKPYATIAEAVAQVWDTGTTKTLDFTINISGKITGNQTIANTVTNAKSITLLGDSTATKKELSAGGSGIVLVVSTAVPITIQNLTITDGYTSAGNGGGICMQADNAKLTLTTGVVITGNHAGGNGGGIYFSGNTGKTGLLIMNSTASIKGNTTTGYGGGLYMSYANLCMSGQAIIGATSGTAPATVTSKSNMASDNGGGGIYADANTTIYLGYSAVPSNPVPANAGDALSSLDDGYGVVWNYTGANGGGIYSLGTIYMASGSISKNGTTANGGEKDGGGVYIGSGGTFTMYGGSISGNKASYGGGVANSNNFYMTGGNISNNEATNNGGGLYNTKKFFMSGTAIIGKTDATTTVDSNTDGANKAAYYGGGIINTMTGAQVFIGYTDENTTAALTGGVIGNYAGTYGGGICFEAMPLKVAAGKISFNKSRYGGGIYTEAKSIDFDGSTYSIEMKDNVATVEGGAINFSTPTSQYVNIQGSVSIPSTSVKNNDIKLGSGNKITVKGILGGTGAIASITPDDYSSTSPVLAIASGVTSITLPQAASRFAVTDDDATDTTVWFLNSQGKIASGNESISALTTAPTEGEWSIYTQAGLEKIVGWAGTQSMDAGASYKLENDIVLSDWSSSSNGIFKADTFDGNGHKLIIESLHSGTTTIFGYQTGNAVKVKNLVIEGEISSGYLGLVTRFQNFAVMTNVVSKVNVNYTGTGACAGLFYDGGNDCTVINCRNEGNIYAPNAEYVGGIYAEGCMGVIIGCVNTGNITGKTKVGGICGETYAKLRDCRNEGTITGEDMVGGIAGDHHGFNEDTYGIFNCVNTGSVKVIKNGGSAGGICGILGSAAGSTWNWGTVQNSVNLGSVEAVSVTSNYLGGIVGKKIADCNVVGFKNNYYIYASSLKGIGSETNVSGICDTFTKSGSTCNVSNNLTVGDYTGKDVVQLLNSWLHVNTISFSELSTYPLKAWRYSVSKYPEFDE